MGLDTFAPNRQLQQLVAYPLFTPDPCMAVMYGGNSTALCQSGYPQRPGYDTRKQGQNGNAGSRNLVAPRVDDDGTGCFLTGSGPHRRRPEPRFHRTSWTEDRRTHFPGKAKLDRRINFNPGAFRSQMSPTAYSWGNGVAPNSRVGSCSCGGRDCLSLGLVLAEMRNRSSYHEPMTWASMLWHLAGPCPRCREMRA